MWPSTHHIPGFARMLGDHAAGEAGGVEAMFAAKGVSDAIARGQQRAAGWV